MYSQQYGSMNDGPFLPDPEPDTMRNRWRDRMLYILAIFGFEFWGIGLCWWDHPLLKWWRGKMGIASKPGSSEYGGYIRRGYRE